MNGNLNTKGAETTVNPMAIQRRRRPRKKLLSKEEKLKLKEDQEKREEIQNRYSNLLRLGEKKCKTGLIRSSKTARGEIRTVPTAPPGTKIKAEPFILSNIPENRVTEAIFFCSEHEVPDDLSHFRPYSSLTDFEQIENTHNNNLRFLLVASRIEGTSKRLIRKELLNMEKWYLSLTDPESYAAVSPVCPVELKKFIGLR